MQLAMAFRVKKLTVRCAIRSTQYLGDDVVAVPTCFLGDRFAATDALSALRSPEIEQHSTTCKGLGHEPALTSLEVHLPCGMIWIRVSLDLDVTTDREGGCVIQPHDLPRSIVILLLSEEAPRSAAASCEVPSHDPACLCEGAASEPIAIAI